MDTIVLFQRLGVALAIGLLVGLERGWQEREGPKGSRTAGIRTHALIALLGGIWAASSTTLGPIPLSVAGLGFAAAFTLFAWRESVADENFSVTGVIAALLTFALGVYAVLGDMAVAAATGVAAVGILAARAQLHEFLRRLTWPEVRSAIVLLAMTFLLLPILPDHTIDPWDSLNPFKTWLMAVIIAAISYAGYAAIRIAGQRVGPLIAASIGALVSSTAVTLANARLAAKTKQKDSFAAGILIAWLVSLCRVAVIGGLINRQLIEALIPAVSAAGLVLALGALFFFLRTSSQSDGNALHLKNPFELGAVLLFTAGLAFILVISKMLSMQFGNHGLYFLAAFSGLVDVDPIALSVPQMVGSSLMAGSAAAIVMLAAASNIVSKSVVALVAGGLKFGLPLGAIGGVAILVGAISFVALGHV